MKTLALLLFALPAVSSACQTPTADRARQYASEARAAEENYALATADRASYIIVARVTKVAREEDARYRHAVELAEIEPVSGPVPPVPSVYLQSKNDDGTETVTISCRRDFRQVDVWPTYRYVLYIRDGRILRATQFQEGPPALTGAEEVALLKASGR